MIVVSGVEIRYSHMCVRLTLIAKIIIIYKLIYRAARISISG